MPQVITFESYRPSPRYDEIPWTDARIEEGPTADGPWTELETITLDPVDDDPANPIYRNFTTELASDDPDLWYRIVFLDETGDALAPTDPVQNTGEPEAGARDLCTLEDVYGYLPAYNPTDPVNDKTNRKLAQLITSESEEIIDEVPVEIIAAQTGPRDFDITAEVASTKSVEIGALKNTDELEITVLNANGTESSVVDTSAVTALYLGRRRYPTYPWEPIRRLRFETAKGAPVLAAGQVLSIDGNWGFPEVPAFVREACAARVILRYVSDVADAGTDFAEAADNLNLVGLRFSAQAKIDRLTEIQVG